MRSKKCEIVVVKMLLNVDTKATTGKLNKEERRKKEATKSSKKFPNIDFRV